jgi:phosphoribosylamine--glycine ligase
MMRLKTSLITLVDAAIDGKLDQVEAEWDRRVALGVVMAAANYPATPRQGDVIHGLPAAAAETSTAVAQNPASHVFHAGTKNDHGQIITAGGRVLCVTALGDNIKEAQKNAYAALAPIHFDGMQYRHDIGHRALKR